MCCCRLVKHTPAPAAHVELLNDNGSPRSSASSGGGSLRGFFDNTGRPESAAALMPPPPPVQAQDDESLLDALLEDVAFSPSSLISDEELDQLMVAVPEQQVDQLFRAPSPTLSDMLDNLPPYPPGEGADAPPPEQQVDQLFRAPSPTLSDMLDNLPPYPPGEGAGAPPPPPPPPPPPLSADTEANMALCRRLVQLIAMKNPHILSMLPSSL